MLDVKPSWMEDEKHSADTHLAEARDQNPGNGISGNHLKNKLLLPLEDVTVIFLYMNKWT